MTEYKQYRRTQIAELAPWHEGMDMRNVSISNPDLDMGSPKPGDMIARNPKNHADQWLVSKEYFEDNFAPLDETRETIWAVTAGEHSDYRVVGIFSTEENADIIAEMTDGFDVGVGEWPLDPAIDQLNQGLTAYDVRMRRDGLVLRVEEEEYSLPAESRFPVWDKEIIATVWAKDEEHAVKIVNEKRAQLIAQGEL